MWHVLSYPFSKGIFKHTVEDECLEEHNKYIKETYETSPDSIGETNEILIDPGGMALVDGSKTTITLPNNMIFKLNDEHIMSAVIGYFSMEILNDAVDRYAGLRDLESGYTVRMMNDNIIKVYLPFNILVMTADTYMDLAGELEKLYLKGLNAYLSLASVMPDEYFILGLGDALVSDEIGEA